jgi:hypothetical protein
MAQDKIRKNISDHIKYRNTVMTGEVTAVNSDGTYDVKIAQASSAYPDVEALDYNANFSVGEIVDIAFEYGNRELPKIMGTAKKIAQEPSVVEVDYTSNLPNEPEPEPEPEPDIQLFEYQPDTSVGWAIINKSSLYLGQHFTVESNHTLEKIALYLLKYNELQTDGTAYIDIYNADVNGYPTGAILATISVDTSLLPPKYEGTDWDWSEYTLDAPINLTSGSEIVIVVRFPEATYTKTVYWGLDVPIDDSGRGIQSSDSGASWERDVGGAYGGELIHNDFTFKIYGRLN